MAQEILASQEAGPGAVGQITGRLGLVLYLQEAMKCLL